MRRTIVCLAAVLMGSALGFAQQQEPSAKAQVQPASKPAATKTKAAKPKISKYTGTVDSVDAAANKLSVKNAKGSVKEFTLGADVKITKGGKLITFGELAAGDRVTVSYEGTADAPEVKSIVVAKAKKK
ncbi:MAG: hypothetical protein HY922_13700 [Elusimicrobia bacterium]|nr:hypothetical protein [Elusimicrobiota bacterium]